MDGDDVAGNLDNNIVLYQYTDGDDVAGNLDKTTLSYISTQMVMM